MIPSAPTTLDSPKTVPTDAAATLYQHILEARSLLQVMSTRQDADTQMKPLQERYTDGNDLRIQNAASQITAKQNMTVCPHR